MGLVDYQLSGLDENNSYFLKLAVISKVCFESPERFVSKITTPISLI